MQTTTQPEPGLTYPDLLLPKRDPWWRMPAAVVFGIVAAVFVGSVLTQLVLSLAFGEQTPVVKTLNNLGPWIVAAFLVPFALPLIYRVSPRFAISVDMQVRWRTLLVGLGAGLIVVALAFAVAVVSGSFEIGREPDASNLLGALVVVAFLVPLQCTGEEVLFRGLFTQSLSTRIRARWVVALITSLLFAVAHGGFTPLRLGSLLLAALLLWWLMWISGGLEASVAMHTTNNWISYGLPLFLVEGAELSGSLDALLTILFTLLAFAAGALAVRLTKPRRLVATATSVEAGV